MTYKIFSAILAVTLLSISPVSASRLKDLTHIEGGRDNQLIGYGLVTGLAGDGDSTTSIFTLQAISNSLESLGIQVPAGTIKSNNVAAVMLTTDIGPYIRPGARIDVTVSSLGDADSLQGGVLLQTPMLGADGVVYAVAQGPIAVGGFLGGSGGAGGATIQQNHPTVGIISNGAIVERRIKSDLFNNGRLNLLLHNPDFTSSVRIADAVNATFPGSSLATDSGTVNVIIPDSFIGQETNFMAAIGALEALPDVRARVIVNERTGTIVATSSVRISTVAISHGSLTITIASGLQASQPGPLSEGGETVVLPSSDVTVDEAKGSFLVVEDLPTIERLTSALNALGVTTREMMSILQTMKKAGALQAELILN